MHPGTKVDYMSVLLTNIPSDRLGESELPAPAVVGSIGLEVPVP